MAKLKEVVGFMDEELNIGGIPDYPAAMNGLQLENEGSVKHVVAAVDASLPVIEKAVKAKADLLIVHHGMFWQGAQRHVGSQYRKLRLAMDSDLAIYSAHIPLDVHPVLGNNACLARELHLERISSYHAWKGIELGLTGELGYGYAELIERMRLVVGNGVHHCPGRKNDNVGKIGIITGGAGSEIQMMAQQGIETFITGEGPHWSYPLAEELGVNLIYGGHYATETFGVIALAEYVSKKFNISFEFIDHPTGL